MNARRISLFLAGGFAACTTFVHSQNAPAQQAAPAAEGSAVRAPPMPLASLKPVAQGEVTYLCGGVGRDESDYMKTRAKGYDLMLTFAARDGSYLSDVSVDIKDPRGNKVLETSCDGPILLVDLPHGGKYQVHAEAAGYMRDTTVNVPTKRAPMATAVMTWPQRVAQGAPSAAVSSGSSGASGSPASAPGGKGDARCKCH